MASFRNTHQYILTESNQYAVDNDYQSSQQPMARRGNSTRRYGVSNGSISDDEDGSRSLNSGSYNSPQRQLSDSASGGYSSSRGGKPFSRKSKAGNHHYVTPSGVSPAFRCTFVEGETMCDAELSLPSKMRDHLIHAHTRFSPFQCDHCKRVFTRGSLQTRHLIKTSAGEKRACPNPEQPIDDQFKYRRQVYEALWEIRMNQEEVDRAVLLIERFNGVLEERRRRGTGSPAPNERSTSRSFSRPHLRRGSPTSSPDNEYDQGHIGLDDYSSTSYFPGDPIPRSHSALRVRSSDHGPHTDKRKASHRDITTADSQYAKNPRSAQRSDLVGRHYTQPAENTRQQQFLPVTPHPEPLDNLSHAHTSIPYMTSRWPVADGSALPAWTHSAAPDNNYFPVPTSTSRSISRGRDQVPIQEAQGFDNRDYYSHFRTPASAP